ncbi:MAG: SufBD protein [Candidatus Aegiribacteria sp.]|nr:SufBD protein [Candidatus Aegiribacteria sp.]MBD3294998.1 SufBD protein [Candidatus Fermentibacteria bacterium]
MGSSKLIEKMYSSIGESCSTSPDVAHVEIHGNEVLGLHLVHGLHMETEEMEDGIRARVRLDPGVTIEKPINMCFGLIPEEGVQRIIMDVEVGDGATAAVVSTCTFPNALDVVHEMEAEIRLGEGAEYNYLERHVHSPDGGIKVVPRSRIVLGRGAVFRSDFEMLKGRVGKLDILYDAECGPESVLEMSARISASGDDSLLIHEKANLAGERSRGVLTTNIAVRDRAEADIRNTLRAEAAYARGHVDCKEIVRDEAKARAVPIVEVVHPLAHVTHEAAIGSVDSKQLETLMAHGLDEDSATDLIIEGLLAPRY